MHELDKILIRNPAKFNAFIQGLIKNKIDPEKDLERLFILLIIYNYILTSPVLFEAINKENKEAFIKICSKINHFALLYTFKSGLHKTTSAQKTERSGISVSLDNEIKDIHLFLSNNSTSRTYKTINTVLSRSVLHHFSEIDSDEDQDFIESFLNGLQDDSPERLSFSEIRNQLFELIVDESDSFSESIDKQYLFYYTNAIKCDNRDYICFYKPLFLALSEYQKYLIDLQKSENALENDNSFIAYQEDFRDNSPGRITFEDITRQKEFKYLEELLFEDHIIDTAYNFIQKRGNKKNLATIYKFIIKESYFRKSNYKQQTSFQDYQFRQYLDHRYNVDTSQQFKNITDKDVKLYFQSKRWKYDLNKLIVTDFFKLNTL